MSDIDPAVVLTKHQPNAHLWQGHQWCLECGGAGSGDFTLWPCEPYRLAKALAAEQAKAARVSTVVEDYAQKTTPTGRDWHVIRRLRGALADGGEL